MSTSVSRSDVIPANGIGGKLKKSSICDVQPDRCRNFSSSSISKLTLFSRDNLWLSGKSTARQSLPIEMLSIRSRSSGSSKEQQTPISAS